MLWNKWCKDYYRHLTHLIFLFSGGIAKTKKAFFRNMRKIPFVKKQVQAEIAKTAKSIQQSFVKDLKPGMSFYKRLPDRGMSAVSGFDTLF